MGKGGPPGNLRAEGAICRLWLCWGEGHQPQFTRGPNMWASLGHECLRSIAGLYPLGAGSPLTPREKRSPNTARAAHCRPMEIEGPTLQQSQGGQPGPK